MEVIFQWEEENKGPQEQKRWSQIVINTAEVTQQGTEKEMTELGGRVIYWFLLEAGLKTKTQL